MRNLKYTGFQKGSRRREQEAQTLPAISSFANRDNGEVPTDTNAGFLFRVVVVQRRLCRIWGDGDSINFEYGSTAKNKVSVGWRNGFVHVSLRELAGKIEEMVTVLFDRSGDDKVVVNDDITLE